MRLRERLGTWLLKQRADAVGAVPLVPTYQVGRPVFSTWSTERAISRGLAQSEWVYACVRKLASAMASVPWFVEQRVGEDEWERDNAHPLSNLLAQPNPQMNRGDLMERLGYHLFLGGNGIWHLELVQNTPVNLVPLPPDQVKPLPAGRGLELEGYEYRVGSSKHKLPPEEVAHFMFVDPSTPFWGLAPLRAAMATVETDTEAVRWNKLALANRAVTDGVFAFKHPLSDEQWVEARQQVREQHMGVENAHTPWVLGAEATFTPMGLSPVEMDFLKTRQFNVASICAIFQVPVVLVSAERTTYNNMQTGRRMFWQDTMIPLLDDVADALDLRFTPIWNPEGLSDATKKALRINYDASQVPAMQEVWDDRVKTARSIWDMGVPFDTVNQRMELGFDAVPGGDVPWGGKEPLVGAPAPEATKRAIAPALSEEKSALDEGARTAYYKAFDGDRARWEQHLAESVAELFLDEGERAAEACEGDGSTAVARVVTEGKERWGIYLRAAFAAMIAHFGTLEGRRVLRAIPKSELAGSELRSAESWSALLRKEATWTFPLDDPEVQDFIRTSVAEHVTAMSDTTIGHLRSAIAEGLEANEGAPELAARIRYAYRRWAGEEDSPLDHSRSFLIARTEAGSAVNYGHYMGAKRVGEETGASIIKEWVSVGNDGRTRTAHLLVDRERRAMPDRFSNGLLYPNEPGAPASEVCNCRCVAAHLVEGLQR